MSSAQGKRPREQEVSESPPSTKRPNTTPCMLPIPMKKNSGSAGNLNGMPFGVPMKKKQAAAPVLAAGTSTAYHSTKNVNLKHEQVSLEQILQKFPSVESQLKSTPALEPHLAHLLLLPVPPSGRPLPPFLLAAPQNTPSSMPVGVAPLVPASSASAVAPPPASVAVSPHPAGRSHAFSIRAALEPSSASSTQWRSLAAPSGAPPLSGGGWQPPHSDDAPPAESIEAPLAGQHAYIANTNDTNHTDLMQFHVVSPVQSSDDAQLQLYPLRGAPQQQQPPPHRTSVLCLPLPVLHMVDCRAAPLANAEDVPSAAVAGSAHQMGASAESAPTAAAAAAAAAVAPSATKATSPQRRPAVGSSAPPSSRGGLESGCAGGDDLTHAAASIIAMCMQSQKGGVWEHQLRFAGIPPLQPGSQREIGRGKRAVAMSVQPQAPTQATAPQAATAAAADQATPSSEHTQARSSAGRDAECLVLKVQLWDERVAQELQVLSQGRGTGFVGAFCALYGGGLYCVLCTQYAGIPLSQVLAETPERRITEQQAKQVALGVLRQLTQLHHLPATSESSTAPAAFLHCDIHAGNVCVPRAVTAVSAAPVDGSPVPAARDTFSWSEARLIDFGSAQPLRAAGNSAGSSMSKPGSSHLQGGHMGRHLSPAAPPVTCPLCQGLHGRYHGKPRGGMWHSVPMEYFQATAEFGPSSDLFCVGALLVTCVTGVPPFQPNPGQKMNFKNTARHRHRDIRQLGALLRQQLPGVASGAMRMLQPAAMSRVQCAPAAVAALTQEQEQEQRFGGQLYGANATPQRNSLQSYRRFTSSV